MLHLAFPLNQDFGLLDSGIGGGEFIDDPSSVFILFGGGGGGGFFFAATWADWFSFANPLTLPAISCFWLKALAFLRPEAT